MVTQLLGEPLALISFIFLVLSILSLWISTQPGIWLTLAGIAAGFGLSSQRIELPGLISEFAYCGACYAFYRLSLEFKFKIIFGFVVLVVSLALGLHWVPGFRNWQILTDQVLSSNAPPIQLYLNFDKPLVGLFLLGWGGTLARTSRDWSILLRKMMIPLVLVLLVLFGITYMSGYIKFDLKWFEFSWVWLLANLAFTCVSEEALFRGFLQNEFTRLFNFSTYSKWIGWILASLLFGFLHYKGGTHYILLSTLAGLFYGYAYMKTGRIESSILTHFIVNAVHFVGFTYPGIIK